MTDPAGTFVGRVVAPPLPGLTSGEWAASPWVQAPVALILWIVAFLVVRTLVLGGMRKVAASSA